MKKRFIIKLASIFVSLMALPIISRAADPLPLPVVRNVANIAGLGLTGQAPTVQQVIIAIINYALGFLGIFFLISIMLAGWQWMSSMGDSEKIDKTKSRLKNSIIGIVIVLISFTLTVYLTDIYNKATCSNGYYCPSNNPNPSGECSSDLDCERQFGSANWKCDFLENTGQGSCKFQP